MNIRKWSTLQFTPRNLGNFRVTSRGSSASEYVVPYVRRLARDLEICKCRHEQYDSGRLEGGISSATMVSQRSDTQNVRSSLANAPALHRRWRLRPSGRRIKGCLRNTQTSASLATPTERLAPRCLLPVFCIRIVDDRCDGGSSMMVHYPRDMVGYGATPLEARWPGDARIALNS